MKYYNRLFLLSASVLLCFPTESYANKNLSKEVIVKSKEDINKAFEIGSNYYDNEEYDEAIKVFTKITSKFPGYADAHYYIGLSHFALGKYYQALASFLEANKVYGNTKLDALFGAGLSYLSSGYTEEARAAFQKVIKESKDNELVEDSKNWIVSIEEQLLQKEKLDLITSDINFRNGIEQLDAQKYDLAEEAFRKSLENKPSSLLSLYYLGNTLYLRENYTEAIATFEKIILIDSDSKIANDASLYIRSIRDITANFPIEKPYLINISLGSVYDSNIAYTDKTSIIMSDVGINNDITLGYTFNDYIKAQYNFQTNIFSGINDNVPGLTFKSIDFNTQRHNVNTNFNYLLDNKFLGEFDYNLNWFFLGGNSFTVTNSFRPKLNYYINQNFVTVLQYNLDFNYYPSFGVRNSVDHSLDIAQYAYFMENNLWFKVNYNIQRIFADDSIQKQSGFLENGNKYDLSYRFTNSLLSNAFGFDVGMNMMFNSKLRLNAMLSLNDYQNPDIYRLTVPTSNITTGETEVKVVSDLAKKRFDLRYSIGANYSVPIWDNLSASLSYTYLNNSSNITLNDYIGRSYDKHVGYLNLIYEF